VRALPVFELVAMYSSGSEDHFRQSERIQGPEKHGNLFTGSRHKPDGKDDSTLRDK
jgi:hypothetical protein